MKPDVRATTFSPQNAYFFALLSKLSYADLSEVKGFLTGNRTSEGLGFDRFHWFTVSIFTKLRHIFLGFFSYSCRPSIVPA